MGEECGAEDLGEVAGGVAAEGVHLPEAVLRGDEALGDEEVVERGGADVGDAVGVALDGDGAERPAMEMAPSSWGRASLHGLVDPVAGGDEADVRKRGRRGC